MECCGLLGACSAVDLLNSDAAESAGASVVELGPTQVLVTGRYRPVADRQGPGPVSSKPDIHLGSNPLGVAGLPDCLAGRGVKANIHRPLPQEDSSAAPTPPAQTHRPGNCPRGRRRLACASNGALGQLLGQVAGLPDRERHDRERRVLGATGRKLASV